MNGMIGAIARLTIAIMALRIAANGYLLWFGGYILNYRGDMRLISSPDLSAAEKESIIGDQGQLDALLQIISTTGIAMLVAAILAYAVAKRTGSLGMLVLGFVLIIEASAVPQFRIAQWIADQYAFGAFEAALPPVTDRTPSLFFLTVQIVGTIAACLLVTLAAASMRRRSRSAAVPS